MIGLTLSLPVCIGYLLIRQAMKNGGYDSLSYALLKFIFILILGSIFIGQAFVL